MPTFEITGPDGTKFDVDGPDAATVGAKVKEYFAKQQAPAAPQQSMSGDELRAMRAGDTRGQLNMRDTRAAYDAAAARGDTAEKFRFADEARKKVEAETAGLPGLSTGFQGAFARGVPVIGGLLNEASAALGAATKNPLQALAAPLQLAGFFPNSGMQRDYEFGRDMMQSADENYDKQNPIRSTAAQLAGGVASGVAGARAAAAIPGALNAAGRPALAGAAESILGQGSSLAGQAARGLGAGAAIGAVDAATRAREGEGAERAVEGGIIGGVVGAAAPVVARGVGNLVEYGVDQFGRRQAFRQMGLSKEAGEAVVDAARADTAAGGGAGNVLRAGPDAMVADYGPNVRGLLDTTLQRGGADAARAQEAITQRAAQGGQRLSQQGGILDQAFGPNIDIGDLQTSMRQGAQARLNPLYDDAFSRPIDYADQRGQHLQELIGRVQRMDPGIFNRAQRLMDGEGVQSAQRLFTQNPDGSFTVNTLPDVRQIDYIKRALQDVQRAGDGQGALGGNTNEGRIYGQLARQLRDTLGDLVPQYRTAVSQALTEVDQRNALEFGAQLMRRGTAPGEVRRELQGMTPVERQYTLAGARSWAEDLLSNVKRTITDPNTDAREGMAMLKEFSSRANRTKLEEVLGPQQAGALFRELDDILAPAFELRAAVSQNSKTFPRQAIDRSLQSRNEQGPIGTLTEGEPRKALKKTIQAMTGNTDEARRVSDQRMLDEINRVLTNPRGAAAVQMVRDLERAMQQTGQAPAIATALRQYIIGAAGGALGPANERMQRLPAAQ